MALIVDLLIVFTLLVIVWQDIKSLFISVWALVLLIILSAIHAYLNTSVFFWEDVLLNLAVVVFNISLLAFYIQLRYRNAKIFFETYFGIGDVLMLVAMAIYFPIPDFIFFLTGASIFSLLVYLVFKKIKLLTHQYVPLAGLWSVAWVFYIIYTAIRV